VEHLTPFDMNYQMATQKASQMLQYQGLDPSMADQGSLGMIYGRFLKQASMMAFNDAFYLLSIFMICIIPLVFLMKKGKTEAPAGMH
jgi:DHA2 family multidrug resistance protein